MGEETHWPRHMSPGSPRPRGLPYLIGGRGARPKCSGTSGGAPPRGAPQPCPVGGADDARQAGRDWSGGYWRRQDRGGAAGAGGGRWGQRRGKPWGKLWDMPLGTSARGGTAEARWGILGDRPVHGIRGARGRGLRGSHGLALGVHLLIIPDLLLGALVAQKSTPAQSGFLHPLILPRGYYGGDGRGNREWFTALSTRALSGLPASPTDPSAARMRGLPTGMRGGRRGKLFPKGPRSKGARAESSMEAGGEPDLLLGPKIVRDEAEPHLWLARSHSPCFHLVAYHFPRATPREIAPT